MTGSSLTSALRHDDVVYDNLIVPFDGSASAQAALAPARDLAAQFDARTVLVANTKVGERSSRKALKDRAESSSGSDVDVWVDQERGLGEAVLAAVEHRDDPLICAGVRASRGIVKRKVILDRVVAHALVHAPVPVLVIGPGFRASQGLPLQELVVSLDGSPESELVIPLAVEWANELKLTLTLVGITRVSVEKATAERRYLREWLDRISGDVPRSGYCLLEGTDPGEAICAYLERNGESIMMMSTHGRGGLDADPLGSVAQAVLLHSVRPVVFRRPERPDAEPPAPKREVWLILPD